MKIAIICFYEQSETGSLQELKTSQWSVIGLSYCIFLGVGNTVYCNVRSGMSYSSTA